jgi:hypothetical protein
VSRGRKRPLRRTGRRWNGDFKVDLVEVMCVKWPAVSGLVPSFNLRSCYQKGSLEVVDISVGWTTEES